MNRSPSLAFYFSRKLLPVSNEFSTGGHSLVKLQDQFHRCRAGIISGISLRLPVHSKHPDRVSCHFSRFFLNVFGLFLSRVVSRLAALLPPPPLLLNPPSMPDALNKVIRNVFPFTFQSYSPKENRCFCLFL